MAEQFLDSADVRPLLQEMSCKRMSEGMTAGRLGYVCAFHRPLNSLLHGGRGAILLVLEIQILHPQPKASDTGSPAPYSRWATSPFGPFMAFSRAATSSRDNTTGRRSGS